MLIAFAVPMPVEAFQACRGRLTVARPSNCPACAHPQVAFAAGWTRPLSVRLG